MLRIDTNQPLLNNQQKVAKERRLKNVRNEAFQCSSKRKVFTAISNSTSVSSVCTRSILPPLYKGSLQLMTLSRLLHQLQHYHTTCTRDGLEKPDASRVDGGSCWLDWKDISGITVDFILWQAFNSVDRTVLSRPLQYCHLGCWR